MSRRRYAFLVAAAALVLAPVAGLAQMAPDPMKTPPQLVATYENLADTIIGVKQTEWHLVHSILATTYGHAEATKAKALAKMRDGQSARAEIEMLAGLVSQLANEGDGAVAAVRKRLVEAGHHHHSSSAQQTKYDPGFVIVSRDAKKTLLDAAKAIGRLGSGADAAGLEAEWKKVEKEFRALHEGVGS